MKVKLIFIKQEQKYALRQKFLAIYFGIFIAIMAIIIFYLV